MAETSDTLGQHSYAERQTAMWQCPSTNPCLISVTSRPAVSHIQLPGLIGYDLTNSDRHHHNGKLNMFFRIFLPKYTGQYIHLFLVQHKTDACWDRCLLRPMLAETWKHNFILSWYWRHKENILYIVVEIFGILYSCRFLDFGFGLWRITRQNSELNNVTTTQRSSILVTASPHSGGGVERANA